MMNERVAKEQSVRESGRSSRTLWTDSRLYYYSAAFSHKVKENEEKESQKTAAPQLAEHTHTQLATGEWAKLLVSMASQLANFPFATAKKTKKT